MISVAKTVKIFVGVGVSKATLDVYRPNTKELFKIETSKGALAFYPDRSELTKEYPELEEEDIRQALAYAAAYLDDKVRELHGV